jgi:hypothetical protein
LLLPCFCSCSSCSSSSCACTPLTPMNSTAKKKKTGKKRDGFLSKNEPVFVYFFLPGGLLNAPVVTSCLFVCVCVCPPPLFVY